MKTAVNSFITVSKVRRTTNAGHPTNFFYKLANQDTRIWLTVTLPCKVQQARHATTNNWKHVVLYFMNKEEDILIG